MLDTQDPELLLRKGVGFCHQAAWLTLYWLREGGFRATLVRLNGHYAVEVELPSKRNIVVDSDLGIVWDVPLSAFGATKNRSEVEATIESKGFSKDIQQKLAETYVTTADNTRSLFYGLDTLNIEIRTKWWSYYVPLGGDLLWLVGALITNRGEKHFSGVQ